MRKYFVICLGLLAVVIILGACGAPDRIKPANDGGLPPCPTWAGPLTTASNVTVDAPSTDCYQPPYVPPSAPTTIPPLPDDCVEGTTRWSMQPCGAAATTVPAPVVSEPFPRGGTLPETA